MLPLPVPRLPQSEVPLLKPDILVCSVGTEILINGEHQGRALHSACVL